MTVGFDWLLWLLVGALGGLLALLSAVAIANSYRRRHRTPRGGARQFAAERQASHQRPALATSRSQNCPPSRCYREILESIALYCNPN
jgi:hypothetical protein